MENLGLGLLLMGVGMVTVFAILLIVIFGSRGIILIVNKVASEELKAPARNADAPDGNVAAAADSSTMSVLESAVAQLTGGKGRIIKVIRI